MGYVDRMHTPPADRRPMHEGTVVISMSVGPNLGKDLEVVKSAASINFPVGLRVWVKVGTPSFTDS